MRTSRNLVSLSFFTAFSPLTCNSTISFNFYNSLLSVFIQSFKIQIEWSTSKQAVTIRIPYPSSFISKDLSTKEEIAKILPILLLRNPRHLASEMLGILKLHTQDKP